MTDISAQLEIAHTRSIEAERAFLGAAILWPEAAVESYDSLTREMFAIESHGLIWSAIRSLIEEGSSVDLLLLTDKLRQSGDIDFVGGAAYVSSLIDETPALSAVGDYVATIRRGFVARRTVSILREAIAKISNGEPAEEEIISLFGKLSDVGNSREGRVTPMWVPAEAVITGLESNDERSEHVLEIPLLSPMAPLVRGSTCVISGGTSSGKTSLADQLAVYASRSGWPTLVISLEMSREQRASRILASLSGVSVSVIMSRYTNDKELALVKDAEKVLRDSKLFINGRGMSGLSSIVTAIRLSVIKHGVKAAVVDYIQLVDSGSRRSREESVSLVSRTLTRLAEELNIIIFVVAQLSRRHEEEKRAPQLRDLRESGAIEQDASTVLMIAKMDSQEKRAIYIRKQRTGPIDVKLYMRYQGHLLTFSRMDDTGW